MFKKISIPQTIMTTAWKRNHGFWLQGMIKQSQAFIKWHERIILAMQHQ
jgi:hypothetical protein